MFLLAGLPAGGVSVEGVQKMVVSWCQRWPSVQQPSANSCLTVINVRQLLLDALMQEWPRQQQHKGQTLYQVGAILLLLPVGQSGLRVCTFSCGGSCSRPFSEGYTNQVQESNQRIRNDVCLFSHASVLPRTKVNMLLHIREAGLILPPLVPRSSAQ